LWFQAADHKNLATGNHKAKNGQKHPKTLESHTFLAKDGHVRPVWDSFGGLQGLPILTLWGKRPDGDSAKGG
jgi:hypothetical protein